MHTYISYIVCSLEYDSSGKQVNLESGEGESCAKYFWCETS